MILIRTGIRLSSRGLYRNTGTQQWFERIRYTIFRKDICKRIVRHRDVVVLLVYLIVSLFLNFAQWYNGKVTLFFEKAE